MNEIIYNGHDIEGLVMDDYFENNDECNSVRVWYHGKELTLIDLEIVVYSEMPNK